jgi:MFS family permease
MAVPAARRPDADGRLLTPAFIRILVASFIYFVGLGMNQPVMPLYVRGPLAGGDVHVGVVYGVFGISAFFFNPIGGRLGDRFGRRLPVLVGAATVAIAVLLYTVARSLAVLVAVRLLAGAGEALYFVGVATAVNELAGPRRRGEAISLLTVSLFGGFAVGPIVGEALLDRAGFSTVWIWASACPVIAMLALWRLPETRPAGEFAHSGGRMFHPAALTSGIVFAMGIWGQAGFVAFVPLYARELGLGESRFVLASFSATMLVLRALGGRLPDRVGPGRVARASLICSVVGLLMLSLWRSVGGLYVGTIVFTFGQALLFPSLVTFAVAGGPASQLGAMIGTMTAFIDLTFSLGPLSLGAVSSVFGYNGMFLAAALVTAMSLGIFLAHGGRQAPPAARM